MTDLIKSPLVKHIEKGDGLVSLSLFVPKELHYFDGHFPQAPILPGVVQVHWVIEAIAEHFGLPAENYLSVDALKFQVIIGPDYELVLTLSVVNDNKIAFSYSSEHGQHSSGKVVYR